MNAYTQRELITLVGYGVAHAQMVIANYKNYPVCAEDAEYAEAIVSWYTMLTERGVILLGELAQYTTVSDELAARCKHFADRAAENYTPAGF